MKIINRKKVTLILLGLAIFYMLISAFIIFTIQFLETPEILIKVDFDEIGSDNALIKTEIDIKNPNNFQIITKNLELIVTTSDGYEISHVLLEDGLIQPQSKKVINKNITVSFNGHDPSLIRIKINGDLGANILFMEKLIPINMGVISSIEDIINNIGFPSINLHAEIVDIANDTIFINTVMNAYNPNTFEVYTEDVSALIETEEGIYLGKIFIPSGVIPPNDYLNFYSNGSILFDALNADTLFFKINGKVGGKLAGINKNLSFNTEAQIKVPNLEELFFSKDPSVFSIKVDRKITLRGPENHFYLQVNNSNKIDAVLKDVICSVYVEVGKKSYLMGSYKFDDDVLLKSKETTNFSCIILTPWIKTFQILFDRNISDWYVVVVQAKVSISGLNQVVFVELKGYEDQHTIR